MGTELVAGEVADTNTLWLARRVVERGLAVTAHVTVGDEQRRLVDALVWLVERSDAVVVGGGLGPTPDDLTRAAVAEVAGVPLERHAELATVIEQRFRSRDRHMPAANLRQADLPAGAEALQPIGTAPGFALVTGRPDGGSCVIYALPGVPFELQAMAERDVLPDLTRRGGATATVTRFVHVAGLGESAVAEILEPLTDRLEGRGAASVSFLAGPEEIRVRVTTSAQTVDEARRVADPVVDEIVERLGSAVSGIDEERLEHAVARLLRAFGLTVATAESCTAGGLAARLASVPGASDYLRGGVVAYAAEAKSSVLGVPARVVADFGPVAVPTAEWMARRAGELFDADLGLGATCVAGPTSHGDRKVGTIAWALATRDGPVGSGELEVLGDRSSVQTHATSVVLEALRRHLLRTRRPEDVS